MEIDAEIIVRRPQCRIARFAEPDDGRGRKVVLANTERVLRGLPAPAVGYRGVDLARGFKVHPTTVSQVSGRAVLAGRLARDDVPTRSSPRPPAAGQAYRVLMLTSHDDDCEVVIDLDPGDGIGFTRTFDATGLPLTAVV